MPNDSKSIFTSKMFWTNAVALVGMMIQGFTGKEFLVSVEQQAMALSFINIVLRSITKSAVTWS